MWYLWRPKVQGVRHPGKDIGLTLSTLPPTNSPTSFSWLHVVDLMASTMGFAGNQSNWHKRRYSRLRKFLQKTTINYEELHIVTLQEGAPRKTAEDSFVLSSNMGSPRATEPRGVSVWPVRIWRLLRQSRLLHLEFFIIIWSDDVSSSWVQMCQRNHGFKHTRTSAEIWVYTHVDWLT